MKKIRLGSFQSRLTLALIGAMFFTAAMSNFLIYKYVLNTKFNDLRNKLIVIAQTGALALDADMLLRVPLTREGMNTAQYQETAEKLKEKQKAFGSLWLIPTRPWKELYLNGLLLIPGIDTMPPDFPKCLRPLAARPRIKK